MNTEELKLYVPERLKNRIIMMAEERKLSINKMSNYILEIGIYKLFEEESEYGKLIIKKNKKESDKDGESSSCNQRRTIINKNLRLEKSSLFIML